MLPNRVLRPPSAALPALICLVALLSACTANPPTVQNVSVQEFWTPAATSPLLTHIAVEIEVSEPDGVLDLEAVRIEHAETLLHWDIPAGDLEVQEHGDILWVKTALLGFVRFPGADAPGLPLGNYLVSVVDAGQYEDSSGFSLRRLSSQNINDAILTPAKNVLSLQASLQQVETASLQLLVFSGLGDFETALKLVPDFAAGLAPEDKLVLLQPLGFPGGFVYWLLERSTSSGL